MKSFKKTLKVSTAALVALGVSAALTGCGKQEFKKTEFQASSEALGFRSIPAKVDVVIVPDNSGSMNTALTMVESQMAGFVSSLRNKYWDYRVAKSMMINPSPINKVLINPEFNQATLPDGTPNPSTNFVPSQYAMTSTSELLPLVTSLDASGAADLTYQNTIANIASVTGSVPTGPVGNYYERAAGAPALLRRDALLAVIVVTNGAEYTVDPNHNGTVNMSLLQSYANQFKSLRNSGSLVRFYPVAANSAYLNGACLGGPAYIGTSYSTMVTGGFLGGITSNICNSGALSSVLSSIENDLSIVREAFVHEYLVIAEEPIESSIQVSVGGRVIPKDNVNGWSYLGGPQTVHTITGIQQPNGTIIPFLADAQTGWVIKLNGSEKIIGNSAPTITYNKP